MGSAAGGVTSEIQPCGWPLGFNNPAVIFPDGREADKTVFVKNGDFFEAAKEGKYKGTERNRARRWYRVGERPVGGASGAAAAVAGSKPAGSPPPFRPGQV